MHESVFQILLEAKEFTQTLKGAAEAHNHAPNLHFHYFV